MHGWKSDRNMKYDEFFYSTLGSKILEEEALYVVKYAKNIVLSIGCGTGIIEKRIEEISNVKIIGVEIDDKMLKEARKRINVIKANAMALPFKNSTIDTVVFITSLEFIEDYVRAINEAYRVLKEEGKIIAILLNTSSAYFKQKYGKEGYIKRNIKHLDIQKIIEYIAKKFIIKKEELFGIANDIIKPGNSVYGIVGIKRK